ncbi:MAG TPA: hypothetical protein VK550_02725, partial [Polyangiaceae bacterium]|nr:hypothetical protein [Polyangiaceae bacterium]
VLAAVRGPDVVAKMMALLPEQLRHDLEGGKIVPSGWYPVAWKRELHQAGRRVTGEPRLARFMGNEMTKRDLNGVYRAFIRIASPAIVLEASARIFSRYLRPGTMTILEQGKGFARVFFENCHDFDENMWNDVLGGCEAALELTGSKVVRIQIEEGGGDGDSRTTATGSWTKGKAGPPVDVER